jgi:hypothetical protein
LRPSFETPATRAPQDEAFATLGSRGLLNDEVNG